MDGRGERGVDSSKLKARSVKRWWRSQAERAAAFEIRHFVRSRSRDNYIMSASSLVWASVENNNNNNEYGETQIQMHHVGSVGDSGSRETTDRDNR